MEFKFYNITDELHHASMAGGVIYIQPYIRSDGSQVRGYYRSK